MSHRRNNTVVLIESGASALADSAAFAAPKASCRRSRPARS
jgi:hypothetical protein